MRNEGVDLALRLYPVGLQGFVEGENTLRLLTNLQLLAADFTDGIVTGFTPQYAPGHLLRSIRAHRAMSLCRSVGGAEDQAISVGLAGMIA